MPPLYYGDPEVVREMNRNVTTLASGATLDQQIAVWSSLVTPVLEGHLHAILSDWPAADSTNSTVIGTLWCLGMTMFIQTGKFATNTPGSQSAYGGTAGDLYSQILKDMEKGTLVVPGATRMSRPGVTNASRARWKISDKNQPDEPEGVADTFPRGLRV